MMFDGWFRMGEMRKEAMFRGIVGAPPCLGAESVSQQGALAKGDLPLACAAHPPAAAGPSTGQLSSDLQTHADGDDTGRVPRDDGHVEFAGKLDMADDIALMFHLASEGKLEMADDIWCAPSGRLPTVS
jgi:hypothetical protein